MNFMGGCAACFCSAACAIAVPNGKVKSRKTSNKLEHKHLIKKEIPKRTIKLPQLYMILRLAIELNGSKPDFQLLPRSCLVRPSLHATGCRSACASTPA
ncbi:hypothetical protein RJJ65_06215 [Rhizobium hidalgonense]|uniref:Uncharacterized protein n=1 Tax=Rhizobium hidalgonense TaxID=1538159 RepID=A0AAJ2GMZ5_9HYPH|nr:hypothetical protein [Rhizobium hidalgonense]MDR9772252.1 hypothetical protein [Rhizobium hidalgonense]